MRWLCDQDFAAGVSYIEGVKEVAASEGRGGGLSDLDLLAGMREGYDWIIANKQVERDIAVVKGQFDYNTQPNSPESINPQSDPYENVVIQSLV